MRAFATELRAEGFEVHYEELSPSNQPYETHFNHFLKSRRVQQVFTFEIEDVFFERRIIQNLKTQGIPLTLWPSPMFLTSREEFKAYLNHQKRPFMKTFYELQRKRLKILVHPNGTPVGDQWSFDTENRLKLPTDKKPPLPFLPSISHQSIIKEVSQLIDQYFPSHPGESVHFWLPIDREGAHDWLTLFLKKRLHHFGPYEDAIPTHSEFVYHSVLTPFLNTGLLTPQEVVDQTLSYAHRHNLPIASTEGFIRQIIGWREFIRGIYQNYHQEQESKNFWNHHRKLSNHWWNANTGVPPLDESIRKTLRYGYAHHIERLMVQGSMMLLLEVAPQEAYRWFMEMYIDSSDWVMGPNVYGMALFSDGGIFATKPYICGSNYYRKMGPYKNEEWCLGVDGLYWQFIEKHLNFFEKNPRLSMMTRQIKTMNNQKKKTIYHAADRLREKLTR
jgi:deoxyribodipyrimidine photolyase-related protein